MAIDIKTHEPGYFPDFKVLTKISTEDIMESDDGNEMDMYIAQHEQECKILSLIGIFLTEEYLWSPIPRRVTDLDMLRTVGGAKESLSAKEGIDLVYFPEYDCIGFVAYNGGTKTALALKNTSTPLVKYVPLFRP